jgi:hypothetical protein
VAVAVAEFAAVAAFVAVAAAVVEFVVEVPLSMVRSCPLMQALLILGLQQLH